MIVYVCDYRSFYWDAGIGFENYRVFYRLFCLFFVFVVESFLFVVWRRGCERVAGRRGAWRE